MSNIEIFEKHFIEEMKSNDFEAFKRTHPTLLKVVLKAMEDKSQSMEEANQLLQIQIKGLERNMEKPF